MKDLWTRNYSDHLAQNVDRWSGPPPDTPWAKWVGGLIVPFLLLWPAGKVLATRSGFILGRGGRMDIHGTDALLLGGAILCLALFLHTHYFRVNSRRLFPFHDLGKTVLLLGFCLCAVWLVLRLFKAAFGG